MTLEVTKQSSWFSRVIRRRPPTTPKVYPQEESVPFAWKIKGKNGAVTKGEGTATAKLDGRVDVYTLVSFFDPGATEPRCEEIPEDFSGEDFNSLKLSNQQGTISYKAPK